MTIAKEFEMVRVVFMNPWVRAGGLLALLMLLGLLMYLLSSVLIPLFFAFIVAYAFDPLIDIFERLKVRRMVTIVCLLMFLLGAALSVPLFVIPGLIVESEKLTSRAAQGIQDQWLDQVLERLPLEDVIERLDKISAPVDAATVAAPTAEQKLAQQYVAMQEGFKDPAKPGALTAAPPVLGAITSTSTTPGVSPESLPGNGSEDQKKEEEKNVRAELLEKIGHLINKNASTFIVSNIQEIMGAGKQVGTTAAGVVGSVLGLLIASAVFIGNFALFLFVTIYLLNDYDHIIGVCDDLVPPRFRSKTRRIMKRIDMQLRAFFRGQGMVCACLGAMYAVGFLASGVPFAVPLAIFGGVASFVPYLGLVLTIGPALLLTLLVHGIDWHLGGVLATFAIAQFLEGNFITPAIVGSQVGLGPVWVILAIMVFGGTMGFTGLLLAVPVAAVLKVVIEEGILLYKASELFGTESTEGAPPGD